MPSDDQMRYTGEERHYNPGLQAQEPLSQVPQTGWPANPNFGTGLPEKLPNQPRRNWWKALAQFLFITNIIFLVTTLLAYNHIINPPASRATTVNPITTPVVQATPTLPGIVPTSVSTPSSTPINGSTPSSTVQPSTSDNYSALQPGPGCDLGGGTWTPQGIKNITCGTQITDSASNTRSYLFLQLPNNKAFSSNNKVGIIGNPNTFQCVGLEEQNANTGFLAEYCGDGHWFMYTISSDGTVVQTLDKNLTSTRETVDISLTLKGTTLSFSIDNEVHDVKGISPIQPTKVAITYLDSYVESITVNNFSYTVLPS